MIFSILKNSDNLISKQDLWIFLFAVIGNSTKEMIDSTVPNDPYGGVAYDGKFKFWNENQINKVRNDFKQLDISRCNYIKQGISFKS